MTDLGTLEDVFRLPSDRLLGDDSRVGFLSLAVRRQLATLRGGLTTRGRVFTNSKAYLTKYNHTAFSMRSSGAIIQGGMQVRWTSEIIIKF
jgi:hypothetical protein